MSRESVRIISCNAYKNRAVRDPESLDYLLPQDGMPTITAFQEVTPSPDVVEAVQERDYQALWLASHGLALALSPDVPVDNVHMTMYPGRNLRRKWGLLTLETTLAGHTVLLNDGHLPVGTSRNWSSAAWLDAQVLGRMAAENPHSLVLGVGDRNHITRRQRHIYDELQVWGRSLLPDAEPTYRLRNGKHRWLAWLGMVEPQLDGMHLRAPAHMEIVPDDGVVTLDHTQVGYRIGTQEVASDHLAVEALLSLPTGSTPPHLATPLNSLDRFKYRTQGAAYQFLHLDHWFHDHPRYAALPKPVRFAVGVGTASVFRSIRSWAGGAREGAGFAKDYRD